MVIFNSLLFIHISGGLLSLFSGCYNLVTRKGTLNHKRCGIIFFYAMLISSLAALPMSVMHPKPFLFLIAVFSLYMLLTGKLYILKKNLGGVKITDWILMGFMFVFAFIFIYLGINALNNANSFGWVFLVFGCTGMLFVYQDQRNFRSPSILRRVAIVAHLQRMVGSYIAAVTAFLVVNNSFLPPLLAWLLPTLLLVPLIIIWSRRYGVNEPGGS